MGRPRTLTDWHIEKIKDLYIKKGQQAKHIADEISAPINAVRCYIKNNHLPAKRAQYVQQYGEERVNEIVKDEVREQVREKVQEALGKESLIEYIKEELPELTRKSIEALEEIITSSTAKDSDKVAAAKAIFQISGVNYAPKKHESEDGKKEFPTPSFNITFADKKSIKEMPDYLRPAQ